MFEMGKNVIRINESQLRRIISESVKKAMKEGIENSDLDNLIAKLKPCYDNLNNDRFFGNEEPQENINSLATARRMCKLLNEFFGGDYIEIVRGGADVILNDEDWFEGAYDMTEEWCNYSLQAKNGTPREVKDELNRISKALERGQLPGVVAKANAKEKERDGGLKVLGKIDLDKVDPKGMNKKRW